MAIGRSEVATIAKSESCLLRCELHKQSDLTSFATEPNQKSNDSAQAQDPQAIPLLLSQRTTAQGHLHRNKNRAVQPRGVNERKNSERKSVSKNVPKQPTGVKDGLNAGKQTVC
jgi:hypothetical protein